MKFGYIILGYLKMKILLKLKYLPLLVSLVCSSFSAELRFAKIFTDHAVLQRDMSVPVWGWAEPEVEVTVEFSSQKKSTTTDKTCLLYTSDAADE